MPTQQLPTTVACLFKDADNRGMAFQGPAGVMNGGTADFSVAALVRSRNPRTVASLGTAETIAGTGDGIATGWKLWRDATSNLRFSVAAAAGERVADLETFRQCEPGALALLLLRVTGGGFVEGFMNGNLVEATAIVGNCLPSITGLVLGTNTADDQPSEFFDVVAFGYTPRAIDDGEIAATAEAARFNAQLDPASGQNFSTWDYLWHASDLVNSAAPGGFGGEVSDEEVEIANPIGLTTWQQESALIALQPNQDRPATSSTVLTSTGTGPQLPAATLAFS